MAEPGGRAGELYRRFVAGERLALARVISLVENRETGYRDLLAALYERTGHARRIGVTGPPGAGKSTLVDRLARSMCADGGQVGVVAVDPTSPFTGGALLGDRVRMGDLSDVPGVYIRSMATRGAGGGLAAATRDVTLVLEAFGFENLLVETVGVGQIEIEVMNLCDTVALLFVPESGDGIQTLKAGLIEIAHLFVVNKADRPGADQLASELDHVLKERRRDGWTYPVLLAQAANGTGLKAIEGALDDHTAWLSADGRRRAVRLKQAAHDLETALRERVRSYLYDEVLSPERIDHYAGRIAAGALDPYRAADEVWAETLAGDATKTKQESSR